MNLFFCLPTPTPTFPPSLPTANFIKPLQSLSDDKGRVHCSLNLNTETGRLSSRRPNLQNQPALEKDKYKIRDAFRASKGKKLIVAGKCPFYFLLFCVHASLLGTDSLFSVFLSRLWTTGITIAGTYNGVQIHD